MSDEEVVAIVQEMFQDTVKIRSLDFATFVLVFR